MDEPNFRLLRKSRTPLRPGDVFRMQLPDNSYLFGSVVLVEPPQDQAPMPKSNLVYIYRHRSKEGKPDMGKLRPENLLLPPIYTNRLGWTRGYFETVGNREMDAADLLPQHCFRRHTGHYFDESGRELSEPSDPCGEWGLMSYLRVDDLVSDALRIPRAPAA